MSNCDERKLLKEIQQMLNKTLEKVKDISKMMKALAKSNMAMKEELSRVQEDLENISEEELQLLEGTSEKFQVVESTKTTLDSEDANDSEDVADLEEFLDLKELVSFNGPCKGPIAVQVHGTPQTPIVPSDFKGVDDPLAVRVGEKKNVHQSLTSMEEANVSIAIVPFINSLHHDIYLIEDKAMLNLDILVEMGTNAHVQADYLACFSDCKCFWLVLKTLECSNKESKKLLYGVAANEINWSWVWTAWWDHMKSLNLPIEGAGDMGQGSHGKVKILPTLVINNEEKQKELTRWCKHYSGVLDLNVDEKLLYHIFSVIHINHDAFGEPNAAMKVMYGQYLCNHQFMGSYAYKMSLEYWFYGRSPLMKVSFQATPCGQGVFKGREMLGMP